MNKQMKQHLETVVNSIVNEDTDAAKAAFHDYLRMKTQSILMGEAEECDDEDDDKTDDKEESDDTEEKDDMKEPKKDDEESDDEDEK